MDDDQIRDDGDLEEDGVEMPEKKPEGEDLGGDDEEEVGGKEDEEGDEEEVV